MERIQRPAAIVGVVSEFKDRDCIVDCLIAACRGP
jgi:hypothetical protein